MFIHDLYYHVQTKYFFTGVIFIRLCGVPAGSRFRVHVKEADNLCVSGPADMVVSEEGIALHSIQTGTASESIVFLYFLLLICGRDKTAVKLVIISPYYERN